MQISHFLILHQSTVHFLCSIFSDGIVLCRTEHPERKTCFCISFSACASKRAGERVRESARACDCGHLQRVSVGSLTAGVNQLLDCPAAIDMEMERGGK